MQLPAPTTDDEDEQALDERGEVHYSDIVMAFASLVAMAAVAPWTYNIIDKLQSQVDPLTAVLFGAVPSLLVIALILSVGVSARS